MASTTKIMTALVAIEMSPDLTRRVSVSSDAVGVEGSSVYLKAGETLTLEQLLYALLLESANDAAAAIAIELAGSVEAFADCMNRKAEELGLNGTHFTNPHGLDHPEHYSTAYDLAVLACYALKNPDFARITSTYKTTIPLNGTEGTRILINHNRMLKAYNGAIGVKTGYTRRCGRCLVSAAERDGVRMIAVTLSAPDDWQDHTALLDYGFSLYASETVADSGSYRYTLPCLGAETETIEITNPDSLTLSLPRDHGTITVTAHALHYLNAPICTGDTVGELIFSLDGKEIARLPLCALQDADAIHTKKSAADRLRDWLSVK